MRRIALGSLLLAGCIHDSLWRAEITGTVTRDGAEVEDFYGRDIDFSYRQGEGAELSVPDWRVKGDTEFEVQFELDDPQTLLELEVGEYIGGPQSWLADSTSNRRAGTEPGVPGPDMGMESLYDQDLDHYLEYMVFEIRETSDDRMVVYFTGHFSDGYGIVDGELVMGGFGDARPPKEAEYNDDQGTDDSCDSFYDTTDYYGDVQANSFCWSAGLFDVCGDSASAQSNCDLLEALLVDPTDVNDCPYC